MRAILSVRRTHAGSCAARGPRGGRGGGGGRRIARPADAFGAIERDLTRFAGAAIGTDCALAAIRNAFGLITNDGGVFELGFGTHGKPLQQLALVAFAPPGITHWVAAHRGTPRMSGRHGK